MTPDLHTETPMSSTPTTGPANFDDEDYPAYTMGRAAEMLGTTPGFLRSLDEIATWSSVRISFDDGNASDMRIAMPALVERGLSAQCFLLAGRLGMPGSLDIDDVRELTSGGMSVGSHGMAHRSWRGMDPATRKAELIEARQRLEEVGGERRAKEDRPVLALHPGGDRIGARDLLADR